MYDPFNEQRAITDENPGTLPAGAPELNQAKLPPLSRPEPEPKPTVGRIVHFVLPNGRRAGEHRAAIVTGAWGGTTANLTVLLDQPDDFGAEPSGSFNLVDACTARAWSVLCDPTATAPGSWHWPERV